MSLVVSRCTGKPPFHPVKRSTQWFAPPHGGRLMLYIFYLVPLRRRLFRLVFVVGRQPPRRGNAKKEEEKRRMEKTQIVHSSGCVFFFGGLRALRPENGHKTREVSKKNLGSAVAADWGQFAARKAPKPEGELIKLRFGLFPGRRQGHFRKVSVRVPWRSWAIVSCERQNVAKLIN